MRGEGEDDRLDHVVLVDDIDHGVEAHEHRNRRALEVGRERRRDVLAHDVSRAKEHGRRLGSLVEPGLDVLVGLDAVPDLGGSARSRGAGRPRR